MKNRRKKNITITDERLTYLDDYLHCLDSSAPSGINSSFIMNCLIDALCLMNEDVRMDMYSHCWQKEKEIKEKISYADGCMQAHLIAEADEYERLINIFNHFGVIRLDPNNISKSDKNVSDKEASI